MNSQRDGLRTIALVDEMGFLIELVDVPGMGATLQCGRSGWVVSRQSSCAADTTTADGPRSSPCTSTSLTFDVSPRGDGSSVPDADQVEMGGPSTLHVGAEPGTNWYFKSSLIFLPHDPAFTADNAFQSSAKLSIASP